MKNVKLAVLLFALAMAPLLYGATYMPQYNTVTNSPVSYVVPLATGTATMLGSVCSYTPPVMITFDYQGTIWQSVTATTTAASVQNKSRFFSGDKFSITPGLADFPMSWAADPVATCSLVITVFPLGQ